MDKDIRVRKVSITRNNKVRDEKNLNFISVILEVKLNSLLNKQEVRSFI